MNPALIASLAAAGLLAGWPQRAVIARLDSSWSSSLHPLQVPSPTGPQAARRRTSQTVAAMSSTDSASSQPPSIHWNGQNRLAGW